MRVIRLHRVGLALGLAAGIACSRTRPVTNPGTVPVSLPTGIAQAQDPSGIYNQMGLIATAAPLSYVGKIAYFASRSPDTTVMLASVSIPNRMLSFVRDGETYRAPYEIRLRLLQGGNEVKSVNATEIVRVATFKEVNRTDESVIFQNFFRVSPGDYTVSFTV